jgi:hypothetical protein
MPLSLSKISGINFQKNHFVKEKFSMLLIFIILQAILTQANNLANT